MRKRIFEIIEVPNENDKVSNIYDIGMMGTIIASLIPLAFKATNIVFEWLDYMTVTIFIIDYILRLITADYKLPCNKAKSFILYPFTPMAIIDLLSILPSVSILNNGFKLLKLFRLLRTLKVLSIVARLSRQKIHKDNEPYKPIG